MTFHDSVAKLPATLSATLRVGLAVAAVVACSTSGAQTVDRQARSWAASCAACHGTDGRTQGQAVPPLAGRPVETLYRSLIEFKTGQRPAATVMHQHSKGYSDDELRRIAQYFAAQTAP